MVGLRKLSSNRNNKENEFREADSMAERQAFSSKDPAVRKVSAKLGARICGRSKKKFCSGRAVWGAMRTS